MVTDAQRASKIFNSWSLGWCKIFGSVRILPKNPTRQAARIENGLKQTALNGEPGADNSSLLLRDHLRLHPFRQQFNMQFSLTATRGTLSPYRTKHSIRVKKRRCIANVTSFPTTTPTPLPFKDLPLKP